MIRPHKKANGKCPYCEDSAVQDFAFEKETINNRQVEKHTVCNKYSLIDKTTGIRFPLQDPTNKNASPYV